MDQRVADFVERTGREPSEREYSAMEHEASGDTRADKIGIDATSLLADVNEGARRRLIEGSPLTIEQVLELLAEQRSTWNRLDVLRVISGAVTHNQDTTPRAWRPRSTKPSTLFSMHAPTSTPSAAAGADATAMVARSTSSQATSEFVLAQD